MKLNMLKKTKTYVCVGLSGGVDSSVAAFLLKKAGHHVEAIFMKNWEEDSTNNHCPISKDIHDAEAICDRLKLKLHVVNFASEYWERVFTYFLDEYRIGRTPNPDILCNKEIKFRAFLDYAKNRGAEFIATGHYARLKQAKNNHYLLKASDKLKDQSYFLHTLNQKQLSQTLFPLGELTKPEVRAIAREMGFINFDKKDSTGICFIGERKFKSFLNEYLPNNPGAIETTSGNSIGEHDGLMFYTLGQRQGLRIGGKRGQQEAPWYVVQKDMKRNVLIVAQGDHPVLYKSSLIVSNQHWINHPPLPSKPISAKIRYRQEDQACCLKPIDHDRYHVSFNQPQRAITPGQAAVFYQDDICLGGGIIEG